MKIQVLREKWPVGIGGTIALVVLVCILLPNVEKPSVSARAGTTTPVIK